MAVSSSPTPLPKPSSNGTSSHPASTTGKEDSTSATIARTSSKPPATKSTSTPGPVSSPASVSSNATSHSSSHSSSSSINGSQLNSTDSATSPFVPSTTTEVQVFTSWSTVGSVPTSSGSNSTSGLGTSSGLRGSSFSSNTGAMAGVIIAAIVGSIAVALLSFFCIRRRRKEVATRNLIFPDKFGRKPIDPEKIQHLPNHQGRGILDRLPVFSRDESHRYLFAESVTSGEHSATSQVQRSGSLSTRSSMMQVDSGMAGVGALGLTGMSKRVDVALPPYNGPFSDYHRFVPPFSKRINTNSGAPMNNSDAEHEERMKHAPPSPSPSSPSIYPASIPPIDQEDGVSFYRRETQRPRPLRLRPAPMPGARLADSDQGHEPPNPFISPLEKAYEAEYGSRQTNSAPEGIRRVPPPIVTDQPKSATPSQDSELRHYLLANTLLGRPVSNRNDPPRPPRRSPLREIAAGRPASG